MFIDKELELSLAQAVTVTAPSTNVIDNGVAGSNQDAYDPLFFYAKVNTTFAAAGAGTLQIQLQTSVDEAFTVPVNLYTSAAFALASLVAGTELVKMRMPTGCLRYLRAYYTVGTGPMTAGKIDCFLPMDVGIKFS